MEKLHVHHNYYKPPDEDGKWPDIWDYEDATLYTLCEDCHKKTTEITKLIKKMITYISPKHYFKISKILMCYCEISTSNLEDKYIDLIEETNKNGKEIH